MLYLTFSLDVWDSLPLRLLRFQEVEKTRHAMLRKDEVEVCV